MRKLLLLCFLLITQTSGAEVSDSLEYAYYTANADPASSLRSVLNSASPIRQNGQIFHGYTRWYVKWNFRWQEKPSGHCRITRVATQVTGNITLPRLSGATALQERQFGKYLSALHAHELGHYDIGKEAAATIDMKILNLPEMPSCKALESAANDLGHQVLGEYKERELHYDDSTGHGKSQGAWLER